MGRAKYNTPLNTKAITKAVSLLSDGLEGCNSARAARVVADTTRQSCLALLAEEMKLLKAAQSEIPPRSTLS